MYRNKNSFIDSQRYATIYVFAFLCEQEASWVKLIDLSVNIFSDQKYRNCVVKFCCDNLSVQEPLVSVQFSNVTSFGDHTNYEAKHFCVVNKVSNSAMLPPSHHNISYNQNSDKNDVKAKCSSRVAPIFCTTVYMSGDFILRDSSAFLMPSTVPGVHTSNLATLKLQHENNLSRLGTNSLKFSCLL